MPLSAEIVSKLHPFFYTCWLPTHQFFMYALAYADAHILYYIHIQIYLFVVIPPTCSPHILFSLYVHTQRPSPYVNPMYTTGHGSFVLIRPEHQYSVTGYHIHWLHLQNTHPDRTFICTIYVLCMLCTRAYIYKEVELKSTDSPPCSRMVYMSHSTCRAWTITCIVRIVQLPVSRCALRVFCIRQLVNSGVHSCFIPLHRRNVFAWKLVPLTSYSLIHMLSFALLLCTPYGHIAHACKQIPH